MRHAADSTGSPGHNHFLHISLTSLVTDACVRASCTVRYAYNKSVLRTPPLALYVSAVKRPQRMSDEPRRDHVQSIERCLAVIEAFTGHAGSMSFSELASETGLSKPTVRRILLTLEALGYARSAGSRFALTPRVLDLGYAYLSSLNLTSVAQPVMEALTDQLRESTTLSALDGVDVVYLNRVHRHRISSLTLAVGTRLPAHATSSGHVLLADLPPEAVADYFRKADLKPLTDRTLATKSALLDRLKKVRTRGWDIVDQELEIGRISAAAPIRDANGVVVAALSFSCGTIERTVEEIADQLLPLLVASAEQISGTIGGSGYAPRAPSGGASRSDNSKLPRKAENRRKETKWT